MSELRKDPVIDRWVIIANERSLKPYEFGVHGEIRMVLNFFHSL